MSRYSTHEAVDLRGLAEYLGGLNMKNDEFSLSFFPTDLIFEILTYMPLKPLLRFQLVCRQWRAIIQERYFMEKYMDRYRVPHYWYYYDPNTPSPNNTSSNNTHQNAIRISYIHGLDGLIIARNVDTGKIIIWNPATRRVLELPDPHKDSYAIVFSFDPSTEIYRTVSVYTDKQSKTKCCEVFTPGHSETWRRLMFPDNVMPKEGEIVKVISSGGVVHCLLSVSSGSNTTFEKIVSLDRESECFVVNSQPESNGCGTKVDALDWDGKLGLAYTSNESINVIVLEDYKKHKWSEKKRIIHLPFIRECGVVVPLFAKKG